jgi:short-subunit dehydrogenase
MGPPDPAFDFRLSAFVYYDSRLKAEGRKPIAESRRGGQMLTDRVALVTGGSAGIGLSVARKLAAQGARLALVARTPGKLEQVAAELGGGDKAVAYALDVADLKALAALPARVKERFGRLDILINNAGAHHRGPLLERSAQELEQMCTVNLTAPMVLTLAAAPLLEKGAVIVNVASLAGFVPVHHAAAYSATKAGIRAFSRATAGELRERGIAVTTVSPGPVDTDFFGDLERVADLTFSQPMSTPEEVADAVLECIRTGRDEIALPWASGKLATLGYLSPTLLRALRPAMEKLGARNKRAYIERKKKRG